MKLLGIVWNPGIPYINEIEKIICKYGQVLKLIYIDFNVEFPTFLNEFYYDNTPGEEMKASQKIISLVNRYSRNDSYIIVIDLPNSEQVFVAPKKKYMYKNVLEMKMEIRNRYSFTLNTPANVNKNFDNIFHCSDDIGEYHCDLLVALRYIVKCSKSNVDISYFTDINKKQRNGTRFNFWITDELFFKQETPNSLEAFSEIFNMHYMQIMNLPTAEYTIAYNGNYRGVFAKRINTLEENLVLLSDIMKGKGITNKKNMIENNYIEQVINILDSYCISNGYYLANNTRSTLLKIYLYDLLFAQNDRNPTNIGLKINRKTGFSEIVCFDHSNMLFFDDPAYIKKYAHSKDCFNDLINKTSKTFLLYNQNEFPLCFKSKLEHITFFLNNAPNTDKAIFNELLNSYSPKLINYIFKRMEEDHKYLVDNIFKSAILNYYEKTIEVIGDHNEVFSNHTYL